MADKVKILIVEHCKIGGKHVEKGTVIDIDPDNAADRTTYGHLVHAGRVGEATKENIAKLKAEMDTEEKAKAANTAAIEASKPLTIEAIVAAVTAAMNGGKKKDA